MAGSAEVTTQRWRGVLDAVAAVSSDLSVDGLLERILRQAGDLVDAASGQLDVLDRRSDRGIGEFAAYGSRAAPGSSLEPPADGDQHLAVPILINGVVLARIRLFDKRSGEAFTREDEEVARAMASAAGVVIENFRLYEQGERQRLWLEAAADITTSLLGPISREQALQLVADRARDVAQADFVALLMPIDATTLMVEAVSGMPADGVLGERVDSAHSIAGDAARSGRNVVVPDTRVEPRYEPHKTPSWPGLGSLMVLPLKGDGDTGALIVGWLHGHQTDRWELDPVVPQRFADQAALVLQVVRAQEDQARLAVFEDRDRIGRDLHDLVIQRLFGIGLLLDNTTKLVLPQEAGSRLSSAIDDIDQTIKDIRRTIFALGSAASADDLRVELRHVVDHAAKLLGFQPRLDLSGPVDSVVSEVVREHLLAVVGEALLNVVRHARATAVTVALDVVGDVELVVTDDGRGLGATADGTGLRNIRHRATLLGGSCRIDSHPHAGTVIRWSVPRRTP